jgi:hypothetical protein
VQKQTRLLRRERLFLKAFQTVQQIDFAEIIRTRAWRGRSR